MKKTFFFLFAALIMLNCKSDLNDINEPVDQELITAVRNCGQSCESFDPYYNNDDGCVYNLSFLEFSEPTTLFFNISGAYFDNVFGIDDFDSNITIEYPGGSFVSGDVNIVRIPCGMNLFIEYSTPIGPCGGFTIYCDEPCCIKNCCNQTTVAISNSTSMDLGKKCCQYEVEVYNGSDCNATLFYGVNSQGINDFVPPNSYKTVELDICPSEFGLPSVGNVILTTDDGNVCFEKEIECNCCALLDIVIVERDPDSSLDCCFYIVELNNRSECDVEIQDKFGQPAVFIPSGETKRTWQRACNGNDAEYPIFIISEDGTKIQCESVILPGDC